mgnify:CR=1 FL=1
MIPFFRRKKETVSIDWAHRYIIHNLVYSYPDETVTPGDYYAVTQLRQSPFRRTAPGR